MNLTNINILQQQQNQQYVGGGVGGISSLNFNNSYGIQSNITR